MRRGYLAEFVALLVLASAMAASVVWLMPYTPHTMDSVPIHPRAEQVVTKPGVQGYEEPTGFGSTYWRFSREYLVRDKADIIYSFHDDLLKRSGWEQTHVPPGGDGNFAIYEKRESQLRIERTNINGPLFGAPWIILRLETRGHRLYTVVKELTPGVSIVVCTLE